MRVRNLIGAIAAAGLVTSPLLAAPSGAPAASEISPASETVDADGQLYGASLLLQLGIVVVVAGAIYLLVNAIGGGGGDDDDPVSP